MNGEAQTATRPRLERQRADPGGPRRQRERGYHCDHAARRLPGTPALTLAVGQQIGAALLLVPAALLLTPPAWPSRGVVGAVFGLALLSTALGFVLYFFLVTSAGPVTAASVTFLIPIFGVLGGTLLMGDPLGRGMLAGMAAILAGVFLVRDARRR